MSLTGDSPNSTPCNTPKSASFIADASNAALETTLDYRPEVSISSVTAPCM